MRIQILSTLLGLVILLMGFLLGYLNFSDIPNATLFSSLLSLALIVCGFVILLRSGRNFQHGSKIPETNYRKPYNQSLLEKNNELMKNYEKHSKLRDKLKTIRHLG